MFPLKESTVSSSLVFVVALYVPLVVIILLELCKCWHRYNYKDVGILHLWPLYNTLRYFLFGYEAQSLLARMTKHTVGRLRPYFFAVCQPLLTHGSTCLNSTNGFYHTNYACRSDMPYNVRYSFPSGHSARIFYGLIFMALYLQVHRGRRWRSVGVGSTLLWPLCQLACVMFATFVALVRVVDHKHHWSDVLAGALLGASIAFVTVRGAMAEALAERQRLRHVSSVQAPPLHRV
ncbi:putative phosphatidate phosphatase [Scaptodrosophila lebanonensis]|uniref:Phosphatidate phosphatase n=1 Tax=Drosophila lebanonensis TaxID=7225 RepID=A0A6J2TMD4_DROLE|nr:putative phosphatidate phosphatase [Scaptodrosophila lebanonensis]